MRVTMTTRESKTYKLILRQVRERGGAVSLATVGDAAALAVEIESGDPDPERLARMRNRLGLEETEDGGEGRT